MNPAVDAAFLANDMVGVLMLEAASRVPTGLSRWRLHTEGPLPSMAFSWRPVRLRGFSHQVRLAVRMPSVRTLSHPLQHMMVQQAVARSRLPAWTRSKRSATPVGESGSSNDSSRSEAA